LRIVQLSLTVGSFEHGAEILSSGRGVDVAVGVTVGVAVFVGVLVAVAVGVFVGVLVGV
jgi:hypothetical protein